MSEIILPSGYKKVDYIQRTTNQYIDTGVVPNSTTMMQTKINMYETTGGMIIGYSNSTSDLYRLFNYSNNFYFDIWQDSGVNRINGGSWPNNTIIEIEFGNHYVKDLSTNTTIISGTTIDNKIVPDTIRIFNNSGSANGCIYYLKIYDNSTLVRDFIPCRNSDGVAGLYDIINNQFYHSASGTEFKAPVDIKHLKPGDVIDFDYTGSMQSVTLPQGTYKLECWGAQGGYAGSSKHPSWDLGRGGYGGYSVGTITLSGKKTSVYIYTGGAGQSSGGGKAEGGWPNGGSSWASSTGEGAGGGGGSSDIRIGQDSLYARVIVAGGGGGGGEDSETGGYGGGTTGGSSGSGSAGSTTSPSGYFGIGGHTSYDGGGGGGGWYGACPAGGSTTPATSASGSDTSGSPGGSGYVYTSSTASQYPSGCLLNSSYYLSDAQTINGGTSFTSPSGTTETGHTGNGYCRITVINCKGTATICTKINSTIKQAKSICFKMNNKIYGFGSSASGGTTMDFDYTGSVQTTTLTPGRYKLECWGAQGGYNSGHTIGKGGYSVGILTLSQNTNIYVYSGGAGKANSSGGGFNGGGNANSTGSYGCSGGGASDIRIGTDSLYARVIVAGGSGGSAYYSSNKTSGANNYGGGSSGGSTSSGNSSCAYGLGGSQTSGGSTGNNGVSPSSSWYGSFGLGGSANGNDNTGYGNAGGGGGWYGGGAGNANAGGGGSGYVYTSSTSSNYPSGCLLNSTYYLTDAQTIEGNKEFPSVSGGTETGHSGNGYVRITKLTDTIYINQQNGVMNFDYTGNVQTVSLNPGTYKLEVWGAQGGNGSSGYSSNTNRAGGNGGYSYGTLQLESITTIYIYVGGKGNTKTNTGSYSYVEGGFNGGGQNYTCGSGGSGGGGTDIRISTDSLYSRVIVAGGGSGTGWTVAGGTGGGTTGFSNSSSSYCGTQTSGGSAYTSGYNITPTAGSFGQGGTGSGSSEGGSGGGGGWYGGGGAGYTGGSGGGSGYVYTSSTASNYPSGCLLNSSYYLTNAQTIAGNQSFTSPTGSSETGHAGNGYVRITNLNPKQYGMFIKRNGTWTHIDL